MKKLNLLLLAFLAVMGVTFQSCDDDDGYSLGDVAVDWATVNVMDNGLFFISILCMIIIRKDMIAQSKC